MAVNWGTVGSAAGDIFGGIGGIVAAGGYSEAADFAQKNAALTARMTGIEVQQAERTALKVLGGQQADVAAAGFSLSGTALDLLADSARSASLDKQLIANKGLIEQQVFEAQAAQYGAMATASTISGIGGIIKGVAGLATLSDIRSKADIKTIGHDKAGRRWVSFRYLWDAPGTVREGVIAQEIERSDPHAILRDPANGLLMVDYSRLRNAEH